MQVSFHVFYTVRLLVKCQPYFFIYYVTVLHNKITYINLNIIRFKHFLVFMMYFVALGLILKILFVFIVTNCFLNLTCSSPASSSSSTVVSSNECVNGFSGSSGVKVIRNGGRKTGKQARPISAVPSELSDISYTTSDDAGIEDESEESNPTLDVSAVDVKELQSTANSIVELSSHWTGRINEAHRIACELLSTEEQYVCVLSLIDQVRKCFK